MDSKESEIATFALNSRLIILVFQCVANAVIPDHDAGVFYPPKDKSQFSWMDHIIHFLFGGLQRWDAVYFTHIIQFGYTYENCIAFFPFYPLVASSISSLLQILGTLHYSSWILLTCVILNVTLFIATAIILYRLGKVVVNENVAYYATMMFCLNPASIFMTAPYSEIMYMFLLTSALLKLNKGAILTASFLIGLSVFTRSNGVIGIGFILHAIAKSLIAELKTLTFTRNDRLLNFLQSSLYLLLLTIINTIACIVLSLAPFFIYQFYIYHKFCFPSNHSDYLPPDLILYGRAQGYHVIGDEPSPWCKDYLPLSYFYIQKHHWDVGFLHYYQMKQLPNFLLAVPIIVLSIRSCLHFLKNSSGPFYTLGLFATKKSSDHLNQDCRNDIVVRNRMTSKKKTKETMINDRYPQEYNFRRMVQSEDIIVYVLHLFGLTVFGCIFIHIQVLTRFLCSSSPLLYWYCGALYVQGKQKANTTDMQHLSTKQNEASENRVAHNTRTHDIYLSILTRLHLDFIVDVFMSWLYLCFSFRAAFVFFVVYTVTGTIMFCNFLPWT